MQVRDYRRLVRVAAIVSVVAIIARALLPETSATEPSAAGIVVYPEQACADGYVVHWSYRGLEVSSVHGTVEQARRLYAVLAAVMVGGVE